MTLRLLAILLLCSIVSCKAPKYIPPAAPSLGATEATARIETRVKRSKSDVDKLAEKATGATKDTLGTISVDMGFILSEDVPQSKEEIQRLNRALMDAQGDIIEKETRNAGLKDQIAALHDYNANRWFGDRLFGLLRTIITAVVCALGLAIVLRVAGLMFKGPIGAICSVGSTFIIGVLTGGMSLIQAGFDNLWFRWHPPAHA